jgi:steroid 5-alpha reductase family enzyme
VAGRAARKGAARRGMVGYAGNVREKVRGARGWGLAVSVAAYVLAVVVAVGVSRAAGLEDPLAALGLATLAGTVVVFAVSVLVDNSSIYDPYWSLQPLAVALYYMWTGRENIDARQIVVTVLLFLYSLRLTSNFYRHWPGLSKEDFRYVSFQERFGRAYWAVSFLGIHLFPTIMVYLGCLPLYALTRPGAAGFGWLDAVGMVVTLGAIVLAFVADEQLRRFRDDPTNKGRVMDAGLWTHSRHPNYLGEMATWWGLWLFALAADPRWWWTVAGALAISGLFVFVSIPLMERRISATRDGYAEYREQTPMLLPRPSR